jgi:hypothetical protein
MGANWLKDSVLIDFVIGDANIGGKGAIRRHRHQIKVGAETGCLPGEVLKLDCRVKIAVKRRVEQIGDALTIGQVCCFCCAQRIAGG